MHIYVIAPADGTRHHPLVASLEKLRGHTWSLVPAQMLSEFPAEYDPREGYAVNARDLSLGEVGCSAAHRGAHRRIVESGAPWACVLEDDARLTDLDGFQAILDEVDAMRASERGTVVSLFCTMGVLRTWPTERFTEFRYPPPGAVASCISREAARRLAATNERLHFVADWPHGTGVQFVLASPPTVAHGDATTGSLIGDGRFTEPESRPISTSNVQAKVIANRLMVYSLVHYWRHRRYFRGVADYAVVVLRSRIVKLAGRLFGRSSGLGPELVVLCVGRRPAGSGRGRWTSRRT